MSETLQKLNSVTLFRNFRDYRKFSQNFAQILINFSLNNKLSDALIHYCWINVDFDRNFMIITLKLNSILALRLLNLNSITVYECLVA